MSLPRSTPSDQGVDAAGILAFLDAVDTKGIDFHSLMVLRHGTVVADGWWAPYAPDRIHLLYSLSKSFTSTAIGIAQDEGLLSIDDPVTKFFHDELPDPLPPYLADTKVRHLLSMASGHTTDLAIGLLGQPRKNIAGFNVRDILATPADQPPGSVFCYNQGCTYLLSAIITKLTGQRLLDYLRPKLFEPLGIDQAHWLGTDEGYDFGFSGLHLVTESVAKLGQLYLQNGAWQGKQVVPAEYAELAHGIHVDTSPVMDNLDWKLGYGFQFWQSRHGGYRGDGAFGQFCVIIPQADAVIVCTAQVADMQAELDLFWEHLLPALSGDAPGNPDADTALAQRLKTLSTSIIDAEPAGVDASFALAGEPPLYAEKLVGVQVDQSGQLTLRFADSEHSFALRRRAWTDGELPGIGAQLPAVAACGGWTAPDEFAADVVFVNSPHRLQLRARGDSVEASWAEPPL